jgi:purine-binding chemotaxis protein CheW
MEKETLLTFQLGTDLFAVEVSNVLEVLQKPTITAIPRAPENILGIVNFRGNIVPVVCTHHKFNLSFRDDEANCILIIFETGFGGNYRSFAATADKVEDVIEIDPEEIQSIPEIGLNFNSKFIRGAIRRKEDFILILDTEKAFSLSHAEIINN